MEEDFDLEPPEDEEPPLELEVDEGALGEAGKNWRRPEPPPLDPAKDPLGALGSPEARSPGRPALHCLLLAAQAPRAWQPGAALALPTPPTPPHHQSPPTSTATPTHSHTAPPSFHPCSVPAAGGGLHPGSAQPALLQRHRAQRGARAAHVWCHRSGCAPLTLPPAPAASRPPPLPPPVPPTRPLLTAAAPRVLPRRAAPSPALPAPPSARRCPPHPTPTPTPTPFGHAGSSVCVFVHGFEPYFFAEAPQGFSPDDCAPLAEELNVRPRLPRPADCLLACLRGSAAPGALRTAPPHLLAACLSASMSAELHAGLGIARESFARRRPQRQPHAGPPTRRSLVPAPPCRCPLARRSCWPAATAAATLGSACAWSSCSARRSCTTSQTGPSPSCASCCPPPTWWRHAGVRPTQHSTAQPRHHSPLEGEAAYSSRAGT
jgi:hypothetical protein